MILCFTYLDENSTYYYNCLGSFSLDDDFEIFAFRIGERRLSMFQLAIVIRLLAFAVFVACVYGGNLLFLRLEHRKLAVYWKILFVTLYSFSSFW